MLRTRLITVLTLNDGVLFRMKWFHPDYRYTMNFVDAWSIYFDEIVALDVTRPGDGDRERFYELVRELARRCFVPLACGGIRTVEDAVTLFGMGADKIVLNTGAVERPELVTELARRYGAQSITVSIDAHRHGDGGYEVYTSCGSTPTGLDPAEWSRRAQELGAGEIFLTSIEKDGSLEGYDNTLNRLVADAVEIPVLVAGGAGKWQDLCARHPRGRRLRGLYDQHLPLHRDQHPQREAVHGARAGIPVRT